MMMREDGVAVEECRAALNKVLDSEGFSGSRRISDFCFYSGQAAIEGRVELGQYEIAEKVLGRATDFNPWDDAAVRKLATQLRHKLDEYYATSGTADSVVISLPRRSYVLRFRRREAEAIPAPSVPTIPDVTPAPELLPEPVPQRSSTEIKATVEDPIAPSRIARRLPWLWLIVGVILGAVPALILLLTKPVQIPSPDAGRGEPARRIIIDTQRGDLRGKELDIAPGAVRLGPVMSENEETSVRLRFSPEYSTQQAGLMALYDADNYVRLGPHFKNRTLLEFGFEQNGEYQGPQSTYSFDPMGQIGQPRWLALRRSGIAYSAYISTDGFSWTTFGNKLTLPDTSGDLHSAVYAFNGRSTNPSERAIFDHFGTGLAFHHRPDGPFQVAQFPGWTVADDCKVPVAPLISDGTLRVGFLNEAIGCRWDLTRVPPAGDWAFSVLVDFEAVSGGSFGISLRGSKANASLTRRDLDGRTIQLEQNNDRDIRMPDFPGTPPVILRMELAHGVVTASVSRDLDTFVKLPREIPISDLGEIKSLNVVSSIAHWTTPESRPPARIYWVRVEPVTPGFLAKRNVP